MQLQLTLQTQFTDSGATWMINEQESYKRNGPAGW